MKKIALVADVKDWAFDIAANIIKNSLIDSFQIDIFYSKSNEFNNDLFKILETLKQYDLIHFFWRGILLDFEKEDFKERVIEKYKNYEKYVCDIVKKISTGVYDHLHEENIEYNKKFTKYCNNYVVSSEKLFEIYNNMKEIKNPNCIMGDTFEKQKFFPCNMERFNLDNEKLVIGWVGNSTWNKVQKDETGKSIDFKGVHTILKPTIEELQEEGYNIQLECADKNIKQIPNDKMCEYYSKIQILVCVANQEGTPKPILEAMGCAIPIITTDVGVINQVLGDKQRQYILGERIIGKNDSEIRRRLKEKIVFLYNNRDTLRELSKENYEYSKYYEIENIKKIYKLYFENCLRQ